MVYLPVKAINRLGRSELLGLFSDLPRVSLVVFIVKECFVHNRVQLLSSW